MRPRVLFAVFLVGSLYLLAWGLAAAGLFIAFSTKTGCGAAFGVFVAGAVVYAFFPRRRAMAAPGVTIDLKSHPRLADALRTRISRISVTLGHEGQIVNPGGSFGVGASRVFLVGYGMIAGLRMSEFLTYVDYAEEINRRRGPLGNWVLNRQDAVGTAVESLDSEQGYVALVRLLLEWMHAALSRAAEQIHEDAEAAANRAMAGRAGPATWNEILEAVGASLSRLDDVMKSRVLPGLRDRRRLSIVEAFHLGHPAKEGDGPFAFELLEETERLEIALLLMFHKDLRPARASRVLLEDIEGLEFVDRWREMAVKVRDFVAQRTLSELPGILEEVEAWLELDEEAREEFDANGEEPAPCYVGSAFAVALHREGWHVRAGLEGGAYLELNGNRLDPFDLVSRLSEESISAEDCRAMLEDVGVGSIPFITVSKPRAT